ncbi:MAG: hypothetical protein HY744_18670 [Deltaproteobacteria bacterium]|nr:hypothetical protein [Deltaproteobacteria bacterium]
MEALHLALWRVGLLLAAVAFCAFLLAKMWPRRRRALRHPPHESGATAGLRHAVARLRPGRRRRMERLLWQKLGELPWDEANRSAVAAAAGELAALCLRRRPAQAAALTKLAALLGARSEPRQKDGG